MRLASWIHRGREGFGQVVDGGVVDAVPRLDGRYPTLRSALAAGALGEVRRATEGASADHSFEEITWLPPIPHPEKILCVGVNYVAHREETGRSESEFPTLFTRFANTQVGHDQPLVRPRASTEFDYEAELAVIVGKPAHHVRRAGAEGRLPGSGVIAMRRASLAPLGQGAVRLSTAVASCVRAVQGDVHALVKHPQKAYASGDVHARTTL